MSIPWTPLVSYGPTHEHTPCQQILDLSLHSAVFNTQSMDIDNVM